MPSRAAPSTGLLVLALTVALPQSAAAQAETLLEQAFILDEGVERPRDPTAAAALYRAAVEQQHDGFAHLCLGYLHEVGDGVAQDYAEARRHYAAAADAGIDEARLRLALCHLEGWGGPVDRNAFAQELRRAAESNYAPAMQVLATAYFSGIGFPMDREAGVQWLERAARLDDPVAQYRLGMETERIRRLGLAADKDLAREWYKLSSEQEYYTAMRAMARSFLGSGDRETDLTLARRWLELASDLGDDEAPYTLGILTAFDRAARPMDAETARARFRLAASRGNMRATEVLELEAAGRPLFEAVKFVLNVPFEERYVERMHRTASDDPTRPPVPTRMVRPIFPQSMRIANEPGEALVSFVVTTKGTVSDVTVTSASHPHFGERAVEAVRQWKFLPGRVEGRLVNTHMKVPVYFKLQQEAFEGADGLITMARDRAHILGGQVAADAVELGVAKPRGRLPKPTFANGDSLPDRARPLLILALDENGQVQRAHLLAQNPTAADKLIRDSLIGALFEPRIVNGLPVKSNVVLPYRPPP